MKEITEKTLVPISMVAMVVSCVFFITGIYHSTNTNASEIDKTNELVERMAVKGTASNRRIYDRLNHIDGDLQYMKGKLDQLNGRITILLDKLSRREERK